MEVIQLYFVENLTQHPSYNISILDRGGDILFDSTHIHFHVSHPSLSLILKLLNTKVLKNCLKSKRMEFFNLQTWILHKLNREGKGLFKILKVTRMIPSIKWIIQNLISNFYFTFISLLGYNLFLRIYIYD